LTGIGDVGDVDTSVTILGHKYATPVMIAPTAFHGAVHLSKEIGTHVCITQVAGLWVSVAR
jgi:isopentenyl diphosphate isomerase/L-lactate dehydrogenase-like FMN-dependent dehydrogenase